MCPPGKAPASIALRCEPSERRAGGFFLAGAQRTLQKQTAPEGAVGVLQDAPDYFFGVILVKAWKASVEALVICS